MATYLLNDTETLEEHLDILKDNDDSVIVTMDKDAHQYLFHMLESAFEHLKEQDTAGNVDKDVIDAFMNLYLSVGFNSKDADNPVCACCNEPMSEEDIAAIEAQNVTIH